MQNKILFLLLIVGILVLPSCLRQGEMKIPPSRLGVVIAYQGKTETAIVVPAEAGEATLLLAKDIQTYIKRLADVDVAIITPKELSEEHKCTIALGIPAIKKVLEDAVGKLATEEYALKSIGYEGRQSIAVVAGSELALQYGGYALVELFMDVRFFHPQHEFLPKQESLFIGRRIFWREKPRFALRGMEPQIACESSEFKRIFTDPDNLDFARAYVDYLIKNKQNVLALSLPRTPEGYSEHYKKLFAYAHMRGLKIMLRTNESLDAISGDTFKELCELGANFIEVNTANALDKSEKVAAAQKILQDYGAKLFISDPKKSADIPTQTGVIVNTQMCRDLVEPSLMPDGKARTQYDALRRLSGKYATLYSPATSCVEDCGLDLPLPNPAFIQLRHDDTVRLTLCGAAGQIHKTYGLEWLSWLNDFAAMRYNWNAERWSTRAVLREFASIFGEKAQPQIEQALLRTIVAMERLHATNCLEDFLAFRQKIYEPMMKNAQPGQKMQIASALLAAVNPVSEELIAARKEIAACADIIDPFAKEWYNEIDDCAKLLSHYAQFEALALAAKSPESAKLMRSLDDRSQNIIEQRRAHYRYPHKQP